MPKTTAPKKGNIKDPRFALKKLLEAVNSDVAKLSGLENLDVFFDEEQHLYIDKRTGEPYAGVSEIIKGKDKGFMANWAALETARYLGWEDEDRTTEITTGKWTYKQWQDLLYQAKSNHRQKSKEAQESGTIAHAWINESIKAEMNGGDMPDIPKDNEESLNAINAYLKWRKAHEVYWHATELTIASMLHRYAGTLDALATVDGKLTLVDFKTSKAIYPEVWLQIAAYKLALEEIQVFPQQEMILRLPKDGTPAEVKFMPMPYDLCRRTFLALREVRRFDSYVNSRKQ